MRIELLEDRRVLAGYTLLEPVEIASVENASYMRAADFDRDGDEDIVFLDRDSDAINVIESIDNAADFGDVRGIGRAPDVWTFQVGDIDTDGDADIVFISSTIHILRNVSDGEIEFELEVITPEIEVEQRYWNFVTSDARLGDWDTDGDLDVLIFSSSRVVLVANNTEEGFVVDRAISVRGSGFDIGDLDGDGDPDIMAEKQWVENRDGVGIERFALDPFERCWRPKIADFTGDGRNDVLCLGDSVRDAYTLDFENEQFRKGMRGERFAGGRNETYVADLDLDGIPEVMATTIERGSSYVGGLSLVEYREDGVGSYEFVSFGEISAGHFAKLDADEATDMLGFDSELKKLVWFRNRVFSQEHTINETLAAHHLKAADVDGDGDEDIVAQLQSREIVWFELEDQGGFSPTPNLISIDGTSTASESGSLWQTEDFDGDGDSDLVSIGRGILTWSELTDDGHWVEHLISGEITGRSRELGIQTLDWNQDGYQDIAVRATQRGKEAIWIYLFDSENSEFILSGETAFESMNLATIDIDSDGDKDIITVTEDGVAWIENDLGVDTLNSPILLQFGSHWRFGLIMGSDLDGDGDLDLVNGGSIALQDKPGEFRISLMPVGLPMGVALSVDIADIDEDSDLDLVFGNSWFQNVGGEFPVERAFVLKQAYDRRLWVGEELVIEHVIDRGDNMNATSFVLVDTDHDGDKDIVWSNRDESGIFWRQNHTSVVDTPTLDFSADGLLDLQDVNVLCQAIRNEITNPKYDVDRSGKVDAADATFMHEVVLGLPFGDIDGDGIFDSSDLVDLFRANQYEDDVDGNSEWMTGDWNCDGEFNSSDLVLAFQARTYVIA